jgi:hypothetical protein
MPIGKKQIKNILDIEEKGAEMAILSSIDELKEGVDKSAQSIKEEVVKAVASIEIPTPKDESETLNLILEEVKKKPDFEEVISTVYDEVIANIPDPIDGKDYVLTNQDKIEIASAIKVPIVEKRVEIHPVVTENIVEVALDEKPEAIRDKLEGLEKDERLDKKAIKGLDKMIEQDTLDRAIGILDQRTSFLINKVSNLANSGTGGSSGVSSVTATSPITSTGGTTPVISTSISTARLVGRTTSGTGVMEQISVASTLSLSALTLGVNQAGTFSWTGQHTFSTLSPIFSVAPTFSTLSAGQIMYAGTAGLLQGNNAFRWDSTLTSLAVNQSTLQPTATVDVAGGSPYTITNAVGLTLTLVPETLISAPTIAEITVAVDGQIDNDGGFTATNQVDLGSGGYTANGQTINYAIYAYRNVNGSPYYTAQLATTSFTDLINDGTTTFNVQIDWSTYTGADGFVIVQTDSGYANQVTSSTLTIKDTNGGFDTGFGVSVPSQTLLLSAGGTRNYRARALGVSPTNVNYYSAAYNYTLSEPTSGSYYSIQHDGIQNVVGSSQMYLYGANDGSTSFTQMALISGTPVTLYEVLNSWGSAPFDLTVVQTPTTYGIVGAGQTIRGRLSSLANIRGYSSLWSSSATKIQSNNLTITNDGNRYYIEASVATKSTSSAPAPVIQSTRYYLEQSANNGSTYPSYTSFDTGGSWVVGLFGYIDATTSFSAGTPDSTPTTFIPAASAFANAAGSGDPFSQSAGFELQTIFNNTTGGVAGAEWRTGGNRAFAMYATANVATIRITGTLRISPISTDLQYMAINATQMELGNTTTGYIFNMISPTYPSAFFYVNNSTSNAFVSIGATSTAGVLGITGNTNMGVRHYFFAQQHGSTNGDYFRGANSSGSPTAYLNNLANWSIGDGTNAVPAYSFTADLDTGMYRVGANTLGFSSNGTLVMSILSTTGQTVIQSTLGNAVQTLQSTATNDDPSEIVYQNRVATTNNTQTTIHTFTVPASTTYQIHAKVTGRRTGGSAGTAEDGAGYEIIGTYKNVAGTATLIGAVNALYTAEDNAAWDATFTVTGATVLCRVTGDTNYNISWHMTARVNLIST